MPAKTGNWLFAFVGLASAMAFSLGAVAKPDAPDCGERRDVLGVSRVIEIDTSKAHRFGRMQYKDLSFLRKGEVVLTFDDGPLRRYTTKVLNALEAECTKATFFMVGRMAVTDPHMVREIAARGHTVATHTWTHQNLARMSRSGAIREIELGISAVSAALGRPAAPFFRFPYLSDTKSMMRHLKDRNVGIFSIDIDAVDFRTRSGSVVVNRILSGLKRQGKGVLLFHDIQRSTAAGLAALLKKLKRHGYKVVHLVAKEPVRTLPKFDLMALKQVERRRKAVAGRPLKRNAITWPVSRRGLPSTEPLVVLPEIVRDEGARSKAGDVDIVGKDIDNKKTTTSRRQSQKRRVRSSSYGAGHVSPPRAKPPAAVQREVLDALQRQIYVD